jgi:hypothetical protein
MENNLTCEFCNKQFVHERNYLKHKCETMKRHELFDSVDGQFAFLAFNSWRKFKNLPPVKTDIFTSSRFFNSFVRFAEYCRRQSIPDRLGFVKMMTEKNLSPFFWCDLDVYDSFVQKFDEAYPIDKKLEISIDTLNEMAETHNCELCDIFSNISMIEVLKLITSRRLSPWLLLPSQKFKSFMLSRTTIEEQMLFDRFVNITKWRKEFEDHPDIVSTVKLLNSKLGI